MSSNSTGSPFSLIVSLMNGTEIEIMVTCVIVISVLFSICFIVGGYEYMSRKIMSTKNIYDKVARNAQEYKNYQSSKIQNQIGIPVEIEEPNEEGLDIEMLMTGIMNGIQTLSTIIKK